MCLEKPDELVALYDEAPPMFAAIQEIFEVPGQHVLDVSSVDREWSDDERLAATAALALHYIQSLRLLARPDVRVRISSIVNTSACLHSVLSDLANECGRFDGANRVWQIRDKIAMAANAVAAAHVNAGGGETFVR
ncbi:hypothetical protein [Actinomycetospora sp.]|jgi:hypothetical protein|uniref:hypothetical protein n=1 Tax=Actinomycetospora sp. TaxID=1872135 RepID=UPI002F3F3630